MRRVATRALLVVLSTLTCIVGATATAQTRGPTLDQVRSSGKLTLGYREASIPFSYLGADQKPVGFALDLCAAIAEKIKSELNLGKLEVAYVPVSASNRIPLLQNGTIDIECGSTTNTLDRQKQVAFSVATFVSQPSWLTMASSGIADANGLRGKSVVFTQGSLNQALGEKINAQDKLDLKVFQTKDHGESILMLRSGRASGFFEDNILLAGLVATAPDPHAFRFLPNVYGGFFYFGLMLRKDDPQFKALVDSVLKAKMASGEFSKAYDKWFTSPIPPNNQNLALPMSDALKARIAAPSDALIP
jgi:glutamate/aspartate transport system substrate-binding protein